MVVHQTLCSGLRGRQEPMKVQDFSFKKDGKGNDFVTFAEGITKTRQSGLHERHRLEYFLKYIIYFLYIIFIYYILEKNIYKKVILFLRIYQVGSNLIQPWLYATFLAGQNIALRPSKL